MSPAGPTPNTLHCGCDPRPNSGQVYTLCTLSGQHEIFAVTWLGPSVNVRREFVLLSLSQPPDFRALLRITIVRLFLLISLSSLHQEDKAPCCYESQAQHKELAEVLTPGLRKMLCLKKVTVILDISKI